MGFILAPCAGTVPQLGVFVETRPSILYVRHCKFFRYVRFMPRNKASARREVEVISAPYDLLLRNAKQFIEIFFAWRVVPSYDFFAELSRPAAAGS